MKIKIDDLSGDEIKEFLEAHVEEMKSVSPPESKHALDLDSLRQPGITFWTVWSDSNLLGCGALKELDSDLAEIKSMRTGKFGRGKGVASFLLRHILTVARDRGYQRISLETGSMPFFEPAHRLYANHGFEPCGPFGEYKEDANSIFMTRPL